jgi:signal transduction histidine kinase
VTWTAFWSTIPLSVIIAVFYVNPSKINVRDSLTWTAIALLSHASMVPFVHYLNKRGSRRVHLLIAFFLGVLKGSVLNLIAPLFLVSDPLPIFARGLNSGIVLLYFFVLVSIIQGVWGKFAKDLRELLLNISNDITIQGHSGEASEDFIDDTERQNAISKLGELLEKSIAQKNNGLTLIEQAQAIDRVIAKNIRPRSSQRWKNAELIWPQIHPWQVIKNAISDTNAPVLVVILILAPLSLVGQLAHATLIDGLLIQALALVLIFLTCTLADRLTTNFGKGIKFNNFLYLIFFLIIQQPIILYINNLLNISSYKSFQNLLQIWILTILTTITLVVTGTVILSVYNAREKALNQIRKFLPEDRLQQIISAGVTSKQESEYAQYLHAEVQSQLTASKLLLLKAADSNFTSMSTETTRKVLARLELLKVPYEKKKARIPQIRLNELTQTWRGLTRIKMDLPPELSTISRNGEIISQLIEESVINAIRHGKAKNVKVRVWIVEEICYIEVQDDGKLKSTKKPGLGSTLFEVFAPDWNIQTNQDGTLATMSTQF